MPLIATSARRAEKRPSVGPACWSQKLKPTKAGLVVGVGGSGVMVGSGVLLAVGVGPTVSVAVAVGVGVDVIVGEGVADGVRA